MMIKLTLADAVSGITETSSLESTAQRCAKDIEAAENESGLSAHFIGGNVKLRNEIGSLIFSSGAFADYINQVGNSEMSREFFRRALEQPSPDQRYTKMYTAVNRLLYSLACTPNEQGSHNYRLHAEIVGQLIGNKTLMLYAGSSPTLTSEALAATPRISVRLETRR